MIYLTSCERPMRIIDSINSSLRSASNHFDKETGPCLRHTNASPPYRRRSVLPEEMTHMDELAIIPLTVSASFCWSPFVFSTRDLTKPRTPFFSAMSDIATAPS